MGSGVADMVLNYTKVGYLHRDGFPGLAAVSKADNVLRVCRGNGTALSGSYAIGTGFGTRSPLF
jgi:hypothetical protein